MASYAEVLRRGSARNQRRRNNAPPPQPQPPPPPPPSPPPPSPPPSPPPPPPPAPPGGQREIQSEPGRRFCPTDEEIIVHYLRRKMADPDFKSRDIPDKDVYSFDPWELYDGEQQTTTQENLFFFTKTVIRGFNRAAKGGHWSMTIPDRLIKIDGVWAGMRRQFEFIKGQEQSKTNWTIYEYSVPGNDPQGEGWVVCRVFEQQESSINNEMGSSSQSAGRPVSNNDGPRQQQRHQLPVNRSSSHSDAPTAVYSRNQQPVNMPATPPGPAHATASSMASITPYNHNMVNPQLRPGPNIWTPEWPPNPNFTQPDFGSFASPDPWFYDHNQHQLNTPTTLQPGWLNPDQQQHFNMAARWVQNQPDYSSMTDSDGRRFYSHNQQNPTLQPGWNPDQQQHFNMAARWGQNQPDYRSMTDSDGRRFYSHHQQNPTMPAQQGFLYPYGPAYPASNMFSTYHYNMVNQRQPRIITPPYFGPNVSIYYTRPVDVGGNFNSYFPRPDAGSSSSHNQRPHFRNDNQSFVRPQGRDSDIIWPDSIVD